MKKEKTVKTHTRKTKSGKTVTVKQHTAKYDAVEEAREIVRKAGAGKEFEKAKTKLASDEMYDLGFTQEEFAEWYEGTGSKADKKVEKILKKTLGKSAYEDLNDAAAEGYKKGGADRFFRKEVYSTRDSALKETPAKKVDSKEASASAKTEKKPLGRPLKTASSIHRYTQLNRFEEGNVLTDEAQSHAVAVLEKEGYKQVGDYLVPPKGKGPLYWNTKHGLEQAGYDDARDLYTGHDILKSSQRKTMESLGYFGMGSSKEKSSKESRKQNGSSDNSGYEKVEFKGSRRANYPTGTFYVKDGKVYQEVDGKMKKVSKKELGAEKYDSVLRRLKASKVHFEGLGGLVEDANRIGHIRSTSMTAMADFGKSSRKPKETKRKLSADEKELQKAILSYQKKESAGKSHAPGETIKITRLLSKLGVELPRRGGGHSQMFLNVSMLHPDLQKMVLNHYGAEASTESKTVPMSVRKAPRRKSRKNTPEEDAALDATLAEIRERNKQPYQVSRRV